MDAELEVRRGQCGPPAAADGADRLPDGHLAAAPDREHTEMQIGRGEAIGARDAHRPPSVPDRSGEANDPPARRPHRRPRRRTDGDPTPLAARERIRADVEARQDRAAERPAPGGRCGRRRWAGQQQREPERAGDQGGAAGEPAAWHTGNARTGASPRRRTGHDRHGQRARPAHRCAGLVRTRPPTDFRRWIPRVSGSSRTPVSSGVRGRSGFNGIIGGCDVVGCWGPAARGGINYRQISAAGAEVRREQPSTDDARGDPRADTHTPCGRWRTEASRDGHPAP